MQHFPPSVMANVLSFDYGERRIGVAVGILEVKTTHPLTTLAVPAAGIPWDRISKIIEEWRPNTLIVGCVIHATQNNNSIQKQVQIFCKNLENRYHLPVVTVDESYTSLKAYEILKDLRKEGRKKILKEDIDKASAAIILDSWFSSTNRSQVNS